MAGKHMAASTGSKKPLVITLAAIVAAAVIGCIVFFVFMNNNKNSNEAASKTTTAATISTTVPKTTASDSTQPQTTAAPSADEETVADTTAAEPETEPEPETTMDINIPTEEGSSVTYFNASYVPNGTVVDLATGETVSLREVFGELYPGGTLTFNDNGTFVDTLGGTGVDTGEYLVEDGVIKATYIYDRNMNITVTEWNEETKTPAEFYITYGSGDNGYQVYFSGY